MSKQSLYAKLLDTQIRRGDAAAERELEAALRAVRDEEREACCKDVCIHCKAGNKAIHTKGIAFIHTFGDGEKQQWLYCDAAAIRGRVGKE